jgi:hypothetical protein
MWTHQPVRLHRALQELRPAPPVEQPAKPRTGEIAEQFAALVEQLLDREAGLLRYSARLDLLRGARRMGIERFEANLIIAAVQQRKQCLPRQSTPWRRPAQAVGRPRQALGYSVPLAALAVVAVEGAALVAVWWMLQG